MAAAMTPEEREAFAQMLAKLQPRCVRWPLRGRRCEAFADGVLYAPDGEPSPGAFHCRAHGEAIVAEYREKLGEEWVLLPLLDHYRRVAAAR